MRRMFQHRKIKLLLLVLAFMFITFLLLVGPPLWSSFMVQRIGHAWETKNIALLDRYIKPETEAFAGTYANVRPRIVELFENESFEVTIAKIDTGATNWIVYKLLNIHERPGYIRYNGAHEIIIDYRCSLFGYHIDRIHFSSLEWHFIHDLQSDETGESDSANIMIAIDDSQIIHPVPAPFYEIERLYPQHEGAEFSPRYLPDVYGYYELVLCRRGNMALLQKDNNLRSGNFAVYRLNDESVEEVLFLSGPDLDHPDDNTAEAKLYRQIRQAMKEDDTSFMESLLAGLSDKTGQVILMYPYDEEWASEYLLQNGDVRLDTIPEHIQVDFSDPNVITVINSYETNGKIRDCFYSYRWGEGLVMAF